MKIFYNISINIIYYFVAPIMSVFSNKTRLWFKAHNKSNSILNKSSENKSSSIWFHCASHGEYKQISPLIYHYQKNKKNKIFITFFSSSGYNNINNNHPTTTILMLPPDTKNKMRFFIKKINPKKVFIAKNEIWPNMIYTLNKLSRPVYFISSKFNPNKLNNFFVGNFYKNILLKTSLIFTQDKLTSKILEKNNIQSIFLGDLRINQIIEHAKNKKKISLINKFKKTNKLILVGSSHKEDYEIISKSINKLNYKWIIVPHEINKNEINSLQKKIKGSIALWSSKELIESSDVLIIDRVGLLQDLYYYADIVYIGGGFSKGIHNCLEAAIYGKPLIFGPKYKSFNEANYFVKNDIAFPIKDFKEFEKKINQTYNTSYINKATKAFFKKNKVDLSKIIERV